jgi:hypothetical protein
MSKITYETVLVKELKIERYNRSINVTAAKKIAAEYDETLMGLIVVDKRDGTYHIIDGQHRVYAANILRIPMVMCQIHEGLTYEEAANLFVKLNRNRRGLLAFDYFKALYEAKDEKIVKIWSLVESVGFSISRGSGTNKVQAINCITNIYEKNGADHLLKVLKSIKDIWLGNEKSLNKLVISGMSEFIDVYGKGINERLFVEHLRKVEPYKITSIAESDATSCSKKIKAAKAILHYYNYKLNQKLPNKFEE